MATLLLITSTSAFCEQGSWRDLNELGGETIDAGGVCGTDTLPADMMAYRDIDNTLIWLARKNKDLSFLPKHEIELQIDLQIHRESHRVESNVFDRQEQVEKFTALINARIAKLRKAKAFCMIYDEREDRNKRYQLRLLTHYLIEAKQLPIGIKGPTWLEPMREIKEYSFDGMAPGLWSVLIPMSMNEGRLWEETRFTAKPVPIWFTVSCAKASTSLGECKYDVTRFEYPYLGDDNKQHAWVYSNGKFTRN